MKKLILILIGLLSIFSDCKRDSDVLATFDNGKVLRSDIRSFYELKEIPVNPNTTSVQNQTGIVEDISIQMICEIEFKKNNPNSNPKFDNILEVVEKQLMASIWKKNSLERMRNNSDVELVEAQLAVVRKTNPAQLGIEKSENVLNSLKALKSEKEISDFISKNTEEDSRKPLGGLLEPHCINCGKDPVTEILFGNHTENPKGQFFKREIDGNFYIVRILEIRKIKPAKLEKYFLKAFNEFKAMADNFKNSAKTEDEKKSAAYYADDKANEKAKMTAEHVLKQFDNFQWNEEYSKLKQESGLTLSPVMLPQSKENSFSEFKPETVIFTRKDNSKFTFQNLDDYYEKVNIFKRKGKFSKQDELKEKMAFFHQVVFPSIILNEKKEAAEIRKSEKFIKNLEFARRSIAFALVQSEIQNKDYPTTEKELKDTYEIGKMYAYSTPSKSDPKKRDPLPFASVRDRIVAEVENSKKKSEYDKIINRYKNDYHLKVFSERFSVGEI